MVWVRIWCVERLGRADPPIASWALSIIKVSIEDGGGGGRGGLGGWCEKVICISEHNDAISVRWDWKKVQWWPMGGMGVCQT